MTLQEIIVVLIILFAAAYFGSLLWKRVRSFSPKSSCGPDCGCGDSKEKA